MTHRAPPHRYMIYGLAIVSDIELRGLPTLGKPTGYGKRDGEF